MNNNKQHNNLSNKHMIDINKDNINILDKTNILDLIINMKLDN